MRIIAGDHRGRRLTAPKGMATRPTTDRVRESLMSMIHSARDGFDDAVVLDAFAGSGALGLEVLSRGARRCVFCELDRNALAALESNISALGVADATRVLKGDVLKRPPQTMGPYDLVFFDPPYALDPGEVLRLLDTLRKAGALTDDVLISYEHGSASDERLDVLLETSPFRSQGRRRWRDTSIDFLCLDEGVHDGAAAKDDR